MGGFSYMSLEREDRLCVCGRVCVCVYVCVCLLCCFWERLERQTSWVYWLCPILSFPWDDTTLHHYLLRFSVFFVCSNPAWTPSGAVLSVVTSLCFPWEYMRHWDYTGQSHITWTKTSVTSVGGDVYVCVSEMQFPFVLLMWEYAFVEMLTRSIESSVLFGTT